MQKQLRELLTSRLRTGTAIDPVQRRDRPFGGAPWLIVPDRHGRRLSELRPTRRAGWAPERIPRLVLWSLAGMTFSGWIATVAGWWVTEIGRQPFVVYGLLRTADVAATTVPSPMIALTFTMYMVLYVALIFAYVTVLKYMAEKPEDVLQPDLVEAAGAKAAAALAAGGRA